jgi:hypothetical protein
MSDTDDMKAYLAQHPKMIGALFTLILLVSQAGTALAGNTTAVCGP